LPTKNQRKPDLEATMSREITFAKIATMAQLLDDAGLHDDATIMDELLEAAAEPNLYKEAGLWKNILSRLSGFARKVLFSEYRTMYNAAEEAQQIIDERIDELQTANDDLKQTLARHELTDWRKNAASVIAGLGRSEADTLSDYDKQHAQMTARLLKLAPKGKADKGSAVPPLLPKEELEEGSSLEKTIEDALKPEDGPVPTEEPIPLTNRKLAPEVPPVVPAVPPTAPEAPVVEPLAGWKKERFGASGKHGWEWEWEVSPDNNKLRLPTSQLKAAASGKGKILHHQDGRYRPTGGTSSVKLRTLMGDTYWEEEDDPSAPGMSILVRSDEKVKPPLSIRQEPTEQVKKLKDLSKSSTERMERLIALAIDDPISDDITDEEKLETAALALLGHFEAEERESEDI
jgi:hypothetical protein